MKMILNFFNNWYLRYLLVTELFIVSKWERALVNTIVVILVSTFTYTILGVANWMLPSAFELVKAVAHVCSESVVFIKQLRSE